MWSRAPRAITGSLALVLSFVLPVASPAEAAPYVGADIVLDGSAFSAASAEWTIDGSAIWSNVADEWAEYDVELTAGRWMVGIEAINEGSLGDEPFWYPFYELTVGPSGESLVVPASDSELQHGFVELDVPVDGLYTVRFTWLNDQADGELPGGGFERDANIRIERVFFDAVDDFAPRTWIENPANGHVYGVTNVHESFAAAEDEALGWGGHLVTISDQAEQVWLYEQFGSSYHWIGLNDFDVEGSFVWVSGEPVGYTNWCSGEPNDYLGEDTVQMSSGSQCWNDIPDNGGVGIVEIENPPGVDPHFNVAYDNFPSVDPPDDFVHLYGWAPGTALTISIDDPANGAGTDFEVPGIDVASTLGFDVPIGPDFDILTGHAVTVSDGTFSATHEVTGLTITSVDPDTDLVAGVATPGSTVTVGQYPFTVTYPVTAAGDGSWQVDMSADDLQHGDGVAAFERDANGNETSYGYTIPPEPQIRGSLTGGYIEGDGFASSTELAVSIDTGSGPVAVSDPPTTDSDGFFWYQTSFGLEPGFTIQVSDGTATRSLTLVGLTFDELDVAADTASGTSDQPDGTEVYVNVGNESVWEEVVTAVAGGEWSAVFSIDVTDDMGGGAMISDIDGDATIADAPAPPQIRATADRPQDRLEGYNFAPDTTVTLTVDSGDGPVAVVDPPTSDEFGNLWFDGGDGFDLDSGDVVEVYDGTATRSLTLVGLTFDELDVAADTASGTSDQPDGTEVYVNVGNESVWEEVVTAVAGGEWSATFALDVTADMGAQAGIRESDGDATFAESPVRPNIRATADRSQDRVEGYNFAPDTVVSLTVDSGAGPVAVADPPTTGSLGNFDYQGGDGFDLASGDVVEVSDGTTTRTLTVVGLTFDALDLEADTASGTSDQPDGTHVFVGVGNEFVGEEFVATVEDGGWSATFALDVTADMGAQAAIRESDGDETIADPHAQPNIRATADRSQDRVEGYNFAPDTTLTMTVDSGAGPVAVADPPTTDEWGNFDYQGGDGFDLASGDVVEVSDGTTTRTLTLVALTFDVLDLDADTASGTSDQPDGTEVFVGAGNDVTYEEVVATVESGQWSVAFSIDVTADMGAQAGIREPDGDATFADPAARPNIRATADRPQDRVEGYNFTPDTTVTLTVDSGAGPVATADPPTTDEWGNFDYQGGGVLDLVSGDVVEVSDGTTTRTLTLVGLTFDVLDLEADTASGTSDQPDGTGVFVGVGNEFVGEEFVATVEDGGWTATFALDVTADMGAQAVIREPDGDETIADPPELPPVLQIEVYPEFDIVLAWDEAVEMSLSVERDGSEIYGTTGSGGFQLWQDGFDLLAGDRVIVSDGETTKDHVVRSQTIDELLPAPDNRISGTAEPGSTVGIRYNTIESGLSDDEIENATVTADTSGQWSYDLATDVEAGTAIEVSQRDEPALDNDATIVVAYVPAPTIIARPPSSVEGYGWTEGVPVAIEVDGFVVDPAPVPERFGFPWDTDFGTELVDETSGETWTLEPGQTVTASDGDAIKTHVVVDVTFDELDADLDTATGTAPVGAEVEVFVGDDMDGIGVSAIAEPDGAWSVDFAAEGFDVTAGMGGEAAVSDDDGDRTASSAFAPNPIIEVNPFVDTIRLPGWPLGATVTVEIDDDTDPANGVLHTDTAVIEEADPGELSPTLGFIDVWPDADLESGLVVRATDGVIEREHVVTPLGVTSVDLDTDVMTGTANPYGAILVFASGEDDFGRRDTVADADGNWSVDFSAEPADPADGYGVTDLAGQYWFVLGESDDDFDATVWHAPSASAGVGAMTDLDVIGVDGTGLSPVTVTVESATGELLHETVVDVARSGLGAELGGFVFPEWAFDPRESFPGALIDLSGIVDLVPGQIVTASDVAYTMRLEIAGITVDEVDTDADTVIGTADETVSFVVNILSEFAGFSAGAELAGTSWTDTLCDPELLEPPAETCVPVDLSHDSVGLTLAGQADSDFDTFTNVFWDLLPEIDSLSVPAVVEAGETAEVTATFTDIEVPDAHTATIDWGDGTAVETVDVVPGTGPGSGGSLTGAHVYTSAGLYEVSVTVTDAAGDSDVAMVTIVVSPVNDPPIATASPAEQTVQYSDPIMPVTVEVDDVDSATLTASATGLPDGVTLTGSPCTPQCVLSLSGAVNGPAGTYAATISVDDGTDTTDVAVTIIVEPEDATVVFDPDNPVAVRVEEDGGTGSVELAVAVRETTPDLSGGATAPGDIAEAEVSVTLVPVGPGSPVEGLCNAGAATGTGYDALLPVTCTYADVAVNTYNVVVTVDGGYYTGGAEDVVTVYDPTLGFTTGGGWFYWPGTADPDTGYLGDRTNFGYTMKYNNRATSVKGNLLMIRHLPDGSIYRIKSNALDGLALGEGPSVPMGWATFSGKATYLDPTMPEPEGNHSFIVYVEDHDEPGTGVDRFWIEVHNKAGDVIAESSFPRDAVDQAVEIDGGNIVAPHAASGTRPPRVR